VTAFADSHVHLASPAFADDAEAVVLRARDAGAELLVCIGETPEAAVRARAIAARFPDLIAHTCGVHPHEAATWDDARHPEAIREAVALGAVAIGECGLDYHYDFSPREQQRHAFGAQLALAAELARPIVLHTRDAEADTEAFLRDAESAGVRGVLHCYTGSLALAERGLAAGWFVSFSGIITFRNWTDLALLQAVPHDRLLVESDAPYLAPVPFRGKRNESSWVPRTIERLASVRGGSPEQLATQTLANTRTFFGLSRAAHA
jgi:TatD DNase family protein